MVTAGGATGRPSSFAGHRPTGTAFGDDRYEQILEEAQHLIRERGFASVSIRDLAAAVGIKVSSLYYYFPSKEDILYTLMMRTMRYLFERTYGALGEMGSAGPAERLSCMVRVGVLYHIEFQTMASIALTETRNLTGVYQDEARASIREYTKLFVDTIASGQHEGAFDVEDATMAGYMILSGLTRISLWYRAEGRLAPDEIADTFVSRFLALVGYQGPQEGSPLREHKSAGA